MDVTCCLFIVLFYFTLNISVLRVFFSVSVVNSFGLCVYVLFYVYFNVGLILVSSLSVILFYCNFLWASLPASE